MITLGGRRFAGPFLLPFWMPRSAAAPLGSQLSGLYAVLVPGWRPLTFRALHFAETADFSAEALKSHLRYAEWLAIAGTPWNLYVATHEMPFATAAQRQVARRALVRDYRPEFREVDAQPGSGPRRPLLAQAVRNPQGR